MARTIASSGNKWLTRAADVVTAYPLSMACWARPTTNALSALISISDGSTSYWALALNGSGGATAILNTGGGSSQLDQGSSSTGVWNHFGLNWSSGGRKVSFNGTLNSQTAAQGSPGGLDRTQVGTLWSGGALVYNGDIAEAAIWNALLDDAEFAVLAAGVSPLLVRPSALVAYWPLLGQYSPEIDVRAGKGLTLNNAPVAAPHCRVILPASPPTLTKTPVFFHIAGLTKNAAGAALGSCAVKLFRSSDDALISSTTSDGSGNYSLTVANNTTQYYVMAYKAGSPDVAGVTVNTIVGV